MSLATSTPARDATPASGRMAYSVQQRRVAGKKARQMPAIARRDLFRAALLVLSGLLALTAFALPSRAGGPHVLIIPADDGYGLSDCLTEGAACGPIVASAWCKAQGHGTSGAFGPGAKASDVLGTPGPRSFTVTCNE